MSISDRERSALRTLQGYLWAALLCAGFGAVYEMFSHQVYSYWMLYAFVLPLALGAMPLAALVLRGGPLPGRGARCLYNGGVAWLTVGSIFRGVLEIYGTTNRLWNVYPVAGLVLLAAGLGVWLHERE